MKGFLKHLQRFIWLILSIIFLVSIGEGFCETETDKYKITMHVRGEDNTYTKIESSTSKKVNHALISTIVSEVLDSLRREGYPIARLDSIKVLDEDRAKEVSITLNKNSLLISNQFLKIGQKEINYWNGEPLTEEKLKSKIYPILDSLNNIGFPFSSISVVPQSVDSENDKLIVSIDYQLDLGPFLKINAVHFPGIKFSEQEILALSSRLKRGDVFSVEKIEKAKNGLRKQEYIRNVGEIQLSESGQGLVDVYIPIEDVRINRFSGLAGYNPEQDKLTGEIKVELGNILGRGRKLNFHWYELNQDRDGISIFYKEPWVLDYPIHIDLGLDFRTEDSLETMASYEIKVNWEPVIKIRLHSDFNLKNVNYSEIITPNKESRTYWIGGGVEINYLDQNWNPSNGIKVFTSSKLGFQNRDENESDYLRKDEFGIVIARSIFPKIHFLENAGVRDISGDNISTSDLIGVGGIHSVRGFAEEKFRVRGTGWSRSEIRWRPANESFFGIFWDFAWLYREDNRYLVENDFLFSYGFATGFETRVARMNIDIGFTEDNTFRYGRLHMKLETRF